MTDRRSFAPVARRLSLAAALACLFGSGFLSLAYEICWIRKASLVFGTASFALSTVIGVFFAGLAIGSFLSGRISRRIAQPMRAYAFIEFAVGVSAMCSPAFFAVAEHGFGRFYPFAFERFWTLCGVRLLLVTAILLVPAMWIGATLPLFCRSFVRSLDNMQRSVGLLYGINTLGAAVGCAVCGFVLLPYWGADRALYYGGLCNLALAAFAWSAARRLEIAPMCERETAESIVERSVKKAHPKDERIFAYGVAFALAGFVALGNEIVWARFLSLLTYNTVYTYTLTLTVILSGIVLGSILAATPWLNSRRPAVILGGVQAAAAIAVLGTLLLPVEFWQRWRNPDSVAWQLALVALIMLPSATLSGIAFPLAARFITQSAKQAAAKVGWLTAVNTLGGLAGSLAVGFALLPHFGLHVTVLLTTAAGVLGALVVWWWIDEQLSRRTKSSLSVIAAGLWLLIPLASYTRLPADFLSSPNKLLEFREGLSGNIAVIRENGYLRLELDRLWQGESRRTHQVVAAHLPMLLHQDPRRILVIGLGPGQTASRFLAYPIDRLDCVEIEGELLALLPKYFHGGWLNDPRVRSIVEDGRNYVWHTDQCYDVISIEVGQAFRPGVAAFYTQDFYERAKQKLRSDGLLTQFVSLEFFNCEELRSVIGTFADVFPECALFHNRSELLLVGKRGRELALTANRIKLLQSNDRVRRDLDFSYWGATDRRLCSLEVFAANFLAGGRDLRRLAAGARRATDEVPWLEFSASSHRTPAIGSAKAALEVHLSPMTELLPTLKPQDQALITAIRQRNLDNLLAEDCIWQARQELQNGQAAKAISSLRKALEWNEDHVGARMLLGDILLTRGRYSGASHQSREALTATKRR